MLDDNRLKHSLAVAKKMMQIGASLGLSIEGQKELFLLGYNHDIGYQFDINNNHNKIGGNILKASGYKYWKEVYYHGEINPKYSSLYLDILNSADMQVDKYGNDVGYDARLQDIENRYSNDSEIYKKCKVLVSIIKNKFN